jgi:hypothetical protein
MYKETLRGIAGIGIFPVISLLLFVAVFAAAVIRTFRMRREVAHQLAALPLDEPAANDAQESLS